MSDASDRLRQARLQAGFKTSTDAAVHFGWNVFTYRAHESGRGLQLPALQQYAEAFGVPQEWLTFGTGPGMPAIETPDVEGEAANRAVPAIGAAIQSRRKMLGMAQQDLADLLRTDKSTVSRWESGETMLGADRLREIAGALRTTVAVLVGEETVAEPSGAEEVDPLLLAAWRRMNRKARRKLVQIAVIIAEE